jgi:hypothetical protein
VPAALRLPGCGLDGCGPAPSPDQALQIRSAEALRLLDAAAAQPRPGFDPLLRACETDARPPDYARPFADAARRLFFAEDGSVRPPWWEAARGAPRAESAPTDPADALRRLLTAG